MTAVGACPPRPCSCIQISVAATPAAAPNSCCPASAEGYDEIVATWRLPPRIRPALFAFGTLADGFLPFDLGFDLPAAEQQQQQHGAAMPPAAEQLLPPPPEPPGAEQPPQPQEAGCAAEPPSSSGGTSSDSSGGGDGVEIRLCSVVMKAVQSRHPGGTLPPGTESGGAGRQWAELLLAVAQIAAALAEGRRIRSAEPHKCGLVRLAHLPEMLL
jgi:hypothetical protein